MPKPASSASPARPVPTPRASAPPPPPEPPPFYLTCGQGRGARALLAYVGSLPLETPGAQLLAVVVTIRAARTGVGNVTGTDLRSLRLDDPAGALAEVTALGWEPQGDLLGVDPEIPVAVKVPAFEEGAEPPLRFGKLQRSRISGWTSRTISARPVRKLPPAARLAALHLAAYADSELDGGIPPCFPEACYAVLPELLRKGFLDALRADGYRLGSAVRHLSGRLDPVPSGPAEATEPAAGDAPKRPRPIKYNPARWQEWKENADPARRAHAETVERCALCRTAPARVAEAFMNAPVRLPVQRDVRAEYETWAGAEPDLGPSAARFAAEFRTAHGHGPSVKQVCKGLGWPKRPREFRTLAVDDLIAGRWLTNEPSVPWSLAPGTAASEP